MVGSKAPLCFGTLYQVMDSGGHPQKVKANSIYDLEKTDPNLIRDLCRCAKEADAQQGKDAHLNLDGDYADIKPFVSNHDVFVATSDDSSEISRANQMPILLGMFGRHNAARLLKNLERTYPQILKIATASKAALPFRSIAEKETTEKPALSKPAWLERLHQYLARLLKENNVQQASSTT